MKELKTGDYNLINGIVKDTPQNVIEYHAIKQKHSTVFYDDSEQIIQNIILKVPYEDEDYICYGNNSETQIKLLDQVERIDGIIADSGLADKIISHYKESRNINLRSYKSITHVLTTELAAESKKAVLLTNSHMELLDAASEYFDWYGFNSVKEMLSMGYIAGVIEDERLVSVAYTSAFSEKYVDIGIRTKQDYRGKGYAFDSAVKLLNAIKDIKQIPVWNVMEDNLPSLKTCRKLGFSEIGSKFYLCE